MDGRGTLEASSLGDASVWVNNYDYNDPGAEDDLLSIPVDLAGMSGPLVTFCGLCLFQAGSSGKNRRLEVLVVTSCDGIATSVYYKEGDDLDTRTPTAFAFTPSSSQWRTDSIDLSSFIGEDYVKCGFPTDMATTCIWITSIFLMGLPMPLATS